MRDRAWRANVSSHAWAALALLLVLAPLLAFPHALGRSYGWLSALLGIVALIVATALFAYRRNLAFVVALLSLAAVSGWARSPDPWASLSHFCGLALGLLAMATIAAWCRTRVTLAIGAATFVLVGGVALAIGFRSVTPVANKVLPDSMAFGPLHPLPLKALHSRTDVNPNALAAAAILVLPVAAAVAVTRWPFPWIATGLRAAAGLIAAWAAILVLVMQSRSAWMAMLCILWLLLRRWMRTSTWWVAGAVIFLVLPATVVIVGRAYGPVSGAIYSMAARGEIWRDALDALQLSPWLGIGFDYFRSSGFSLWESAPGVYSNAPHAHSIVLQTALDIGLIGLAGYLAVIGAVLIAGRDLARRRDGDEWVRRVGIGAAMSVVSVHIFGVLDAVPLGAKIGIFQWWASGLVLAAALHKTPQSATSPSSSS